MLGVGGRRKTYQASHALTGRVRFFGSLEEEEEEEEAWLSVAATEARVSAAAMTGEEVMIEDVFVRLRWWLGARPPSSYGFSFSYTYSYARCWCVGRLVSDQQNPSKEVRACCTVTATVGGILRIRQLQHGRSWLLSGRGGSQSGRERERGNRSKRAKKMGTGERAEQLTGQKDHMTGCASPVTRATALPVEAGRLVGRQTDRKRCGGTPQAPSNPHSHTALSCLVSPRLVFMFSIPIRPLLFPLSFLVAALYRHCA